MISVAFLAIIVIVSLVCLLLGMSIANSTSRRPPAHEPVAHPHETRAHSGRGGWGGVVALLLATPLILGLFAISFGWLSERSVEPQTATVVTHYSSEGETVAPFPAPDAPLPPDPVTPPRLEEAPADSTATGEAFPAASAEREGPAQEAWEIASSSEIAPAAASGTEESTDRAETAGRGESLFRTLPLSNVPPHLLLGSGLLSLALLIGAGIWIAHRRQHWSLSGMARSTVRSLWVLPVLASIAWVGYLMWPHLSVAPLVRNTDYNPWQVEFVRYIDEKNGDIETQDEFLLKARKTAALEGENLVSAQSELPDWVMKGIQNHGAVLHVPVRSGWKHSPEAARNEARAQALRTIRQDFALAYPDARKWRIDVVLDDLDAKVDESDESKLFAMTGHDKKSPMYQTHLLVELSDGVRGEMMNHWWPELQRFRMTMLTAFGGLLTLVCFAGGACLTLDMRTEGKYRRWLRTATVLVVAAGAAAAHGVLNSLWFSYSV